jgi:phenylpyruvate tautomerase PptA (4-oxalocrotonate tautomerase family)
MPGADVYMWSGASEDAKNIIIRGITKIFEELRIPSQAVEIIIIEVPKEN